jgi:hypothetical protein
MGKEKSMKITNRWKKTTLFLSAAGIISLASFGIYNTVNAVNDLNQLQAGYLSAETSSASSNNPFTGSGCSPYGCAACTSCYFQRNLAAIEIEADNSVGIELR